SRARRSPGDGLALPRMNVVDRGSVGRVRTRFIDLPDPLPLDSGATLAPVRIAYETYGRLAPAKDNVILVCHALSGDAHAAGWSRDPEAPSAVDGFRADERGIKARGGLGWWDGMIGPGKAFDTDRYHVVCTNLIGSCRGLDREHDASGQPGHGLERYRAERDHGRSGLAGRQLLRQRASTVGWYRCGAHGRPRDLSVGRIDA